MIITPTSLTAHMRDLYPEWDALSQQNAEALIEWSRAVNTPLSKKTQQRRERHYRAVHKRFKQLTDRIVPALLGAPRRASRQTAPLGPNSACDAH